MVDVAQRPSDVRAAELADTLLLGCMLNIDAMVRVVLGRLAAATVDVQIVCAGTDGAVSLEDAYVAGRISRRLPGSRTDAALAAEAVARALRTPLEALSVGADARVLEAAGVSDDVAFCAQESVLDVVPEVVGVHDGVATVALRDDAARAGTTRGVDRLDPVSS